MWKSEMWLTHGEKEENLQDLSRREAWLYLKNLSANNRRGTWSGLQPSEQKSGAFMVKKGATFQTTHVQHVGIWRTFFSMNILFNPFRGIRVETKCYVTDAMAPSVSKKTWKRYVQILMKFFNNVENESVTKFWRCSEFSWILAFDLSKFKASELFPEGFIFNVTKFWKSLQI